MYLLVLNIIACFSQFEGFIFNYFTATFRVVLVPSALCIYSVFCEFCRQMLNISGQPAQTCGLSHKQEALQILCHSLEVP